MIKLSKALFLSVLALGACTSDSASTDAARRAIIDTPCAADHVCPDGFACEVEQEHGTATSFCQADDADADCPDGMEREVEDGQAFCKPHGGDDDTGDDGDGTGTGAQGATCASNADCSPGLECEIELEHGTTTRTCQPHQGA